MTRNQMLTFLTMLSSMVLLCLCSRKTTTALPRLSGNAQAISFLGDTLLVPKLSKEIRKGLEKNLADAQRANELDPNDADAIIWLGRRTAYMGRYREAIRIFSRGIEIHPHDSRLYRHRGHRFITIRQPDLAIADLKQAAVLIRNANDETEPDGIPNARNIPLSTLHFNIWYHLGLAYYLKGQYQPALEAYQECMRVSKNPDLIVATSHWLYMTFRLLGKEAEAMKVLTQIHADMDIIENYSYHRLLLLYKGIISPETIWSGKGDGVYDAATGYGLGNWYYYNGQKEKAVQIFRELVRKSQWAAFGAIAAEADLSRM